MSDFIYSWVGIAIAVVTIVSILACAWFLKANTVRRPASAANAGTSPGTTGHVWDGDLAEFNNPLPKWWMNLFWITLVFAVLYLVLYPGMGTWRGMLGWTQTGQYDKERAEAAAKVKP
ncbi:MAG: cbb3-type cytochrome c oxidase N-terminal domain-containing protein, partial [bacterium]